MDVLPTKIRTVLSSSSIQSCKPKRSFIPSRVSYYYCTVQYSCVFSRTFPKVTVLGSIIFILLYCHHLLLRNLFYP